MAKNKKKSREEIYDSPTAESQYEIRDLTPEEINELKELLENY